MLLAKRILHTQHSLLNGGDILQMTMSQQFSKVYVQKFGHTLSFSVFTLFFLLSILLKKM